MLASVGLECEARKVALVEPQADTLEEVARGKLASAREALSDVPFFVDDAGLFVDALSGFPGVYSAHALKTIGVAGLLKLMEGVTDRRARFEAVIGAWSPEGGASFHKGVAHGTLATAPRERGHGFGFDPVFVPDGHAETFAELPLDVKNRISHRGRALAAFAAHLARAKRT